MLHYIYKITNIATGQFYIGKRSHCNPAIDEYMGSGVRIRRAISKYGVDAFRKEILAIFDDEESAYALEAALVTKEMIELPYTYNMHEGGRGGWGHINCQPIDNRPNILNLRNKISSKLINIGGTQHWNEDSYNRVRTQARLNRQKANAVESAVKRKKTMAERNHSKGSKNSQYGTVWCVPADAVDLNGRRRFFPNDMPAGWVTTTNWSEQRKSKTNPSYGKHWFNDGKNNFLLHNDEALKVDLNRGRIKK